jgi:hypothetical protein
MLTRAVDVVLKKNTALIFAAIGGGVVLLLVVGLVYLYWKNRQIYRQYQLVKEQSEAGEEMEKYGTEEDEETH